MLFDMPSEQVRTGLPHREEPPDFDDLRERALMETRGFSLNAVFELVDYDLRAADTFDVTFNGYGGQPIK